MDRMEQVQALRQRTQKLFAQLWDAARDREPLEALASPIAQYPPDLRREELATHAANPIAATRVLHQRTSKSSLSISTSRRPTSRLGRSGTSPSKQRPLPAAAFASTAASRARSPSKPSATPIPSHRAATPMRASPSRTHRQIVSTHTSPTRAKKSPDRTRVPPLEAQHRASIQQQHREQTAWDILNRDDAYFEELNQHRKLYPELYSKKPAFRADENGSPFKHLRCNSFNAIHDLGKKAQLKKPLVSGHSQYNITDFEKEQTFDDDDDDEYESEEESQETDRDDYSDIDDKYFKRFREEELQEIVNTFVEANAQGDPKLTGAQLLDTSSGDAQAEAVKTDDVGKYDANKEMFSMQEVVELTLLHAQQMHMLQSEFSDRITRLNHQIEDLHQEQADLNSEWEKKHQQSQEKVQKLTKQLLEQAEQSAKLKLLENQALQQQMENDSRRSSKLDTGLGASSGRHGSRTGAMGRGSSFVPTIVGQHRLGSILSEDGDQADTQLSKIRQRIEMRRQAALQKRLKPRKPKIRVLPPRNPPKFTSTPMGMSFMERLRWFAETSIQKRLQEREQLMAMEMTANEQRLAHIQQPPPDDRGVSVLGTLSEKSALLGAEFMPMPGTVPAPKHHRDMWAEQGIVSPWGGRFKAASPTHSHATTTQTRKINILNLFDVAMNAKLPSTQSNASQSHYSQQQDE
eukprot:jgi/Hompol1/243/HPOL_000392-RA